MAQNQNLFTRPEPRLPVEEQSSSASPTSSGLSESPRESSITYNNPIFSPTRLHAMPEEPEDRSPTAKSEDVDVEMDTPDTVKLEPSESSTSLQAVPQSKRPRGRPRKHPKSEHSPPKVAKARSKTGCGTCRRRKKKCDETKPNCKNCETNNVHCEGYPPVTHWSPGVHRQRRKQVSQWQQQGAAPLPQFIIQGLDTETDRTFYWHYENVFSKVLNLKPEVDNPFLNTFIPMAQAHKEVMHALLSCAGAHYSKQPHLNLPPEFEERALELQGLSFKFLREWHITHGNDAPVSIEVSTIVFFNWLRTIVEGETGGEWRAHESYFTGILNGSREPEPNDQRAEAWLFCREFYRYHRMSSFITSIRKPEEEHILQSDLNAIEGDNFMPVCEGLDNIIIRIHRLRSKIRERRTNKQQPDVSYPLIMEGQSIDQEIKSITCRHDLGTEQWLCWNFYHTCFWLMLQRSVMSNPKPSLQFNSQVKMALKYLKDIPETSPQQSVLTMPVYMLGTCAYDQEVRTEIEHAFTVLENYSHNGNIRLARRVVLRLWELMDASDKTAWDHESVMTEMGIDTLFT